MPHSHSLMQAGDYTIKMKMHSEFSWRMTIEAPESVSPAKAAVQIVMFASAIYVYDE